MENNCSKTAGKVLELFEGITGTACHVERSLQGSNIYNVSSGANYLSGKEIEEIFRLSGVEVMRVYSEGGFLSFEVRYSPDGEPEHSQGEGG